MSNISSFSNVSLLEVGLPPHMSGVSPTTWLCGNILWKQFLQGKLQVLFFNSRQDLNPFFESFLEQNDNDFKSHFNTTLKKNVSFVYLYFATIHL